jgi:hypothetical protein
MTDKPLGGKAYGSIPHFAASRMGPGDHSVHPGQEAICTIKPRPGDTIIVQEKTDGACVSVANIDGNLVPLNRSGYRAGSCKFEHIRLFEAYLTQNYSQFASMLKPGERVCGEWLAMAHGTLYDPDYVQFSPFIAFDIIREGARILYQEFTHRISLTIDQATAIHCGPCAFSIDEAMRRLSVPRNGSFGYHGAIEPIEGAVWRVEREGRVDFLAKYVRPDKVDGKYLPNISGRDPIWYWSPQKKKAAR